MDTSIENLEQDMQHAETMIQGLQDTVSGSEGMNLTEAQHYLHGVLYANGVSSLNVHGNEGVVDTIKKGLLKIWETIKAAVKRLWDFLFGNNKAQKDIDDVKKKSEQTLKEPEKAIEVNEEKREAFAKHLEALAEEYGQFNEKYGKVYLGADALEVLISATELTNAENDLKFIAKQVRETTTLSKVKDTNRLISKFLGKMSENFKNMKSTSQEAETKIKKLEGEIKALTEKNGESEKEALKASLAKVQKTVSYVNATAKLEISTLKKLESLVDDNLRLFGVKE